MLPHGAARRPPAASRCAVSWVVVVLPLVPVTRIQSAAVAAPCRAAPGELDVAPDRDARAAPPRAAAGGRGGSRARRRRARASNATQLGGHVGSRRAARRSRRRSRRAGRGARRVAARRDDEHVAPSSTSVSATAKPVTPRPSTATRRPVQSACQLVSVLEVASRSAADPLEVEERRRRRRRTAPAMIQKRTTTVISAQPLSSKWWCSGLIRKMRLPLAVILK